MRTDQLTEHVTAHAVELRRRVLSQYFHAMFNGRVQQGPLKGFFLGLEPKWGPGDIATKLFGLYEQEVLAIIEAAATRRTILVNLGAADGYYGVGLVATRHFSRSVCYEPSEADQALIASLAAANGISDRVELFASASSEFVHDLQQMKFPMEEVLVVCDVEGAEFEIFNDDCLKGLRGAEIVIEIHDFMVEQGAALTQALVDGAKRYFKVATFKTGYRDLSGIPELADLSDSDRWLICSEGRTKLMSWLHLSPR